MKVRNVRFFWDEMGRVLLLHMNPLSSDLDISTPFGNQHFDGSESMYEESSRFWQCRSLSPPIRDVFIAVAEVIGVLQRIILQAEEPQCSCSLEWSPIPVSGCVVLHNTRGSHGPFARSKCSCSGSPCPEGWRRTALCCWVRVIAEGKLLGSLSGLE